MTDLRKRLALFVAAVGIIAAGVVAFMAFESYTLDIQAHLEPVLAVNPHGDWNLGIVYPETDVSTKLFVGLSNSAKTDRNFRSVSYTIACQKKTGEDTPEGAISLCPNIEVESQDGFGARQCGLGDLVDEPNSCKLFNRSIVGGQNQHGYSIDILWPDCEGTVQKDPGFDTKTVDCNLDPDTGKFAGVDLAAIISIAVGDIVQAEKCITDKSGSAIPTCVTHAPAGANQLKGDASVSANARFVELHFGKSSQPQAIIFVEAVAKSCGDGTALLTGHEKGSLGQTHGDTNNTDHEVWTVDFGSACIVNGTVVLIGFSKTGEANFTGVKDIFLLDAAGASVGGLNLHID